MPRLFSNEWAAAWGDALSASATYREAGRSWTGRLVLEALADASRGLPETRAVFLDLQRGQCNAARVATDDDIREATFVISGPLAVWLTVLAGEVSPTSAIMRGSLTLTKGSFFGLMPHVGAATALLHVAQGIEGAGDSADP